MHRLAASAVIALAVLSVGTCQLPCTSQLRLLPAFANRFTHCQCSYGEWSEWGVLSKTDVAVSQCASGKMVVEERVQPVISGTCSPNTQTRTVCEAELVDQIILALGLGSSGQVISPGGAAGVHPGGGIPGPPPANKIGSQPLVSAPQTCNEPRKTCQHVTVPHSRGKRSVREELKRPINRKPRKASELDLSAKPTPFNITEHGSRYRRTARCGPYSQQYILFVLDTSGSVGRYEFERVTAVLSELFLFFCHPIKIAVMTYDHEYFVEFCFNCFDNTCGGRVGARQAMQKIDYGYSRSGVRYTHSAGAAQCVCDFMLSQTCGLPIASDCIDVVFITDGHSNDPKLNVCDEVACLHNRYGVTTYAIGIGNAYDPELECISNADRNSFHLFNFLNFDKFVMTFDKLVNRLLSGDTTPNGDPYVCIGTAGVGTNGCK